MQVAELGLFANYKLVLNKNDGVENKDLKGGILVVGALVSTDVFRF
jgi:hypothetical protein